MPAEPNSSWTSWEKLKDYREPFERQWHLNLAFLIGRHYAVYNNSTKRLENYAVNVARVAGQSAERSRIVSNHVLRLFRQKLSDFIKLKLRVSVESSTTDESDLAAAKIGHDVAKYLQNKHAFQSLLRKLWTAMMTFGRGNLYPYFDKTAGASGDEKLEILTPFETYWPKSHWPNPQKEVMIFQAMPIEDIKRRFGVDDVHEETDITFSPVEQSLRHLMDQRLELSKEEGLARVLTHYSLPTFDNPRGKHCVEINEGKRIYEGEIPSYYWDDEGNPSLPVIPFDFYEVPLSDYPMSFIEPLISPQREYNHKVSRVTDHFKKLSGKWLIPFGAGLKEPINDDSGQILYYDPSAGALPQPMTPPGIPPSLFVDIDRCRRDMEDFAASHDVSHSKVPAGVKSGKAITALQERDESQMAPILLAAEEQMGKVFDILLRIVQQAYQEPRTLSVVGESKRFTLSDFTGRQLLGKKTITVSLGSSFPYSKAARQESIIELTKMGIMTPQEAREQLQLNENKDLPPNVQLMAAKQAVENMLKGIMVEVNSFDDHALHLKIINDTRVDPDFQEKAPEEIKRIFEIVADLHQKSLMKEMEARMAMQQGAMQQGAMQQGAAQGAVAA